MLVPLNKSIKKTFFLISINFSNDFLGLEFKISNYLQLLQKKILEFPECNLNLDYTGKFRIRLKLELN